MEATREAVEPEFRGFFADVFGSEFEMKSEADPRCLFGYEVKLSKSADVENLLQRLDEV
jgi:hypothetical protein